MDRLLAQSAFPAIAELPAASPASRLALHERAGLGVARIMARRSMEEDLSARVRSAFGLALSRGPCFTGNEECVFAGVGPGAWLVFQEDAAPDWARGPARDLKDVASVVDQSGAYAVLRLSGPGAEEVLAAGAFVDFHPDVFAVGGVAVTQISLIDAVILRRATETFDVAVFRSFANDFMHFVRQAGPAWQAPPTRAF